MEFDLTSFHGWLRLAHVVPGFVGFTVFWLPIFSRKGKTLHKRAGKIFEICCASVVLSAFISSVWMLTSPISFNPDLQSQSPEVQAAYAKQIIFLGALLGTLSVYTFVPLVLSHYWLKSKTTPNVIRSPGLKALVLFELAVSLMLGAYSLSRALNGQTLWWAMFGLAIAGLLGTRKHWRDVSYPPVFKMQWWYRHMEYIITTGIAFHTAFFVFGGRFISEAFSGSFAMIPWLAPTVIGTPASLIWVAYYKKRFKDTQPISTGAAGRDLEPIRNVTSVD
jgi:hypothetical protein